MGDRKSVIGRRRDQHDLSAVSELRSHGSVHEQLVPLAFNRYDDLARCISLSPCSVDL